MKNIYSSLFEAFLLILLIALLAVPVIISQTLSFHPEKANQAVLGAQIVYTGNK